MDIIDAYYMVAHDLRMQANRKAEIAEMLAKIADAMSTSRMHEKQPKQPSEPVRHD